YHHHNLPRKSIDSGISQSSASCSSSVQSNVICERKHSHPLRKESTTSGRLQWSLKSLRSEFKIKNTEVHFARYQRRLKHRLFTVLLILNIMVAIFDTAWFLLYKVSGFCTFLGIVSENFQKLL